MKAVTTQPSKNSEVRDSLEAIPHFHEVTFSNLSAYRYLFMSLKNGSEQIPHFSAQEINTLKGQELSQLLWFRVDHLYLRSSRLRQSGEPSKLSTPDNLSGHHTDEKTPSIHDLAAVYSADSEYNSEPIICQVETVPDRATPVIVVYEGRHRVTGAHLARREFILGFLCGSEHSCVLSQFSPDNSKYFNKPIFSIEEFTDLHKNNPVM